MAFLPDLQRVRTRCWGTMGTGYQCFQDSLFCVGSEGNYAWACRWHLSQVADSIQEVTESERLTLVGVKWRH